MCRRYHSRFRVFARHWRESYPVSRIYDRIRDGFRSEVPEYIDDAILIVADNVAQYYFDIVGTTTLSLYTNFPNQAPPLPLMFLDFTHPDHITTLARGRQPWLEDWPNAWGVALDAHDIATGPESEVANRASILRDQWLKAELREADLGSFHAYLRDDEERVATRLPHLPSGVAGCVAALQHWLDVYASLTTEEGVRATRRAIRDNDHPRWLISADVWVQVGTEDPYLLWRWHYGVLADGSLDRPIAGYPYFREDVWDWDRATVDYLLKMVTILALHPTFLTVSFMHC